MEPKIEQKQVDMKIGLDVSRLAFKSLVDRVVIITGDSDMVPALKLARIEGIEITLDNLDGRIKNDLREHIDTLQTHTKFYNNQSKIEE